MLVRILIIIFLQAFTGYFMVPKTFSDGIDAQGLYSIAGDQILEQIMNGTEEKMFPFKDKLTAEEMKVLIPVIRAFGG